MVKSAIIATRGLLGKGVFKGNVTFQTSDFFFHCVVWEPSTLGRPQNLWTVETGGSNQSMENDQCRALSRASGIIVLH